MSQYDELLTDRARTDPYDALLDEDEARRKQALQGSLAVATQRNPDERAKVIELSRRTGIPAETVERRPHEARTVAARGIDYDQLINESPRLAEWVSDSENASVAHDDLKSLGTLEWLLKAPKAGLKQGSATVELSRFGMKAMNEGLTDRDEARVRELNAVSAQPSGAENFFSKAYVGLFKTLPQIGVSLQSGAEYGAAGALAGAGTAALLGQLGPQIAVPEEVVTVPAAAFGGLRVGAAFGSYLAARDLEAGNAYLEFRSIQDANGQPLDPAVAKTAALAVGEANAMIEVAGLGVLVKSFPGSEVLLGSLTRESVKAALARPTVTAALGSLAKRFAGVWTAEVAQEVTQEAITILGAEIAKGTAEGEFQPATAGQVGERLGQTAISAAQEFAILSALGPTSRFTRDVVRARKAQESQKVFEALASTDSKLRDRLPEKFREFVAKATEGGPVENVYIPAEKFAEYFQSQPDREEVLRKIPALGEQMEEALASGGDLAIPIADFATYLAPSEHYAGLSQDLRLHPDDMTAREAAAWEKQSESMAKDVTAKADPSKAVYEDVLGQLLASGMEQGTAEKNATLMQSTFRSLGERSGQDPAELYKQYGLTIRRELPAGLKQKAQVDTTIDPLIDQLRAGKVPSEQDVFGQSLAQFLKSKGGLQDQGGELAARDTKKAVPGLVKSDGLTLDAASEQAMQAGFITERSDRALLEALDKELRGKAVYAAGKENQALQEQRTALTDLDEFLSRAGIDLKSADNEAVKALLRQPPAKQGGTELAQRFDSARRGSIQFGQDRKFTINLFDKSDLSTVLHESAHFYLEVLGDLATKESAPQQIKDDYAAILKWMGVKDRSEIKVEQHEKFARGFEAYLMEGKAPSVDMQNVFARFRAWLTAIYRDAKRLNVELTGEVRAVFDRLVATEDEIAAAQESQNYVAIFTTAESAGMSPEAFATYRGTVEAARIEAEESLSAKLLKDITREQKAWWKEERQKMRAEVEAEVHAQPLYRALAFLQKGTNPDGSALEGVTPVKLSKEALIAQYGAEFLKRLPRPYVYAKADGVAPEIVATMFGFGSGDELIQALVNARPMRQLIEGETDARMREKYGDALNDGQLAEEAIKAVHSDKRAELLAAELKALRRKQREVKPFVRASELAAARERRQAREANAGNLPNRDERKIIQRAAQRAIEGKRVREISPALYRAAEAQAARKAFEAAGKEDFETAYLEKRKQLLNHELYRAALEAREAIEKTVDYLRGFDKPAKRAALGKAGADYLEQIDGIRERFDFSRISNIGSQKRLALAEWVANKRADGQEINLPSELLNEAMRKPYKELTYGELQGIRDVVANIDHLSRLKNKLLARQDAAEYDAAVTEIVSSIEANHKRNPIAPDFAPSWGKRFKEGMKRLAAEHTKMEFLFGWLDGEKENGAVWRALFKPLADAETAEQTRMRDARQAMHRIFDRYTKAERAGWAINKTFIPEVGASFNKATLLSVALNVGNEYNKDVLLRGYQWTEAQLNVLLSKLDDKDWQTVQELWDFIDSFWPDIKVLQKDLTGLDPEKVEAAPFVTTTGRSMKGGYYPIQYDSKLSWRQQALEEEQSVQELYGGQFLRATTRKGHTKARTDSGGKAVRLDLGVMTEHVVNVIHDLTHRRALLDVDRLVTSNRVRKAIEETAGRQMYRQLRPWLRNIATDYRSPMTAPEAILNHARAGATIVNMGLKITTAVVQPLGYFNSLELLGTKYAAIGLRDTFAKGDPFRSISRAREFAFERSEQLRNRMTTFDRDVRDQLKRLTETGYVGPIRRSFFFLTGFMDMSVAIPTWLGAYRKAMDGAVEEVQAGDEKAAIDFADSTLRKAQSAGGAKDLAQIQAHGSLLKLFTTFYSYFNVLYNLFAKRFKQTDFTKPKDVAHFTASMLALWFVPAVLSEVIAGRGPGEDESWEEYLKRTAYLWALYPAQSVVLLRDVMNAMGPYGYDGSPALDALEQTARALKIPVKALDEDAEVSRSDVKAVVLATSYWGQLPGRQAWITGSYLFDWMTGEEQPETVAEAARNLAFSRPQ